VLAERENDGVDLTDIANKCIDHALLYHAVQAAQRARRVTVSPIRPCDHREPDVAVNNDRALAALAMTSARRWQAIWAGIFLANRNPYSRGPATCAQTLIAHIVMSCSVE
jgi:hypothetical protein